jgi:predicted RNase H-like HicB family nuclease
MSNEFTAVIEQDNDWYIAYCPEIPGANGQGKTVAECKDDLAAAIAMILADRREDTKRGTSNRAVGEMVAVF